MKLRKELIVSIMLLTVALCGSAANALPVSGTVEGWEPSTIYFEYVVDGRTLSGQIDYAVYTTSPGEVELAGQYVYAYQITNSGSSNVSIDSFAVGILEGATVIDIDFDSSVSGGDVEPFHAYFSPDQPTAQSAAWWFMPAPIGDGVVQIGQQSVVLLFSSNDAPSPLNDGFASIAGGGIGGTVTNLPTPIPEPTTIILLGGSWAMIAAIRGRRSV
jgi:hypothetical protein